MSQQEQQELVYVLGGKIHSEHKGHGRGTYHLDADCPRLNKSPKRVREIEHSKISTYDCCQECAGEVDRTYEFEEMTCGACGETYKRLPAHLRSCSER